MRILLGAGIAFLCLMVCGCSGLEKANKDAENVGYAGGQVMRLPHSAAEGAAAGIAGEPESNPYGR